MPKLTDVQTIIRITAAQRADTLAMPLPKGLHGATEKKVVTMMTERGWLKERWSQDFGPVVKVDQLVKEMIQNDETKEPFT